jgi:hypothetical protein
MANEEEEPPPREKRDPKLELRDLKPKKDPKAGGANPKKPERSSPGTTGEMDFMGWE